MGDPTKFTSLAADDFTVPVLNGNTVGGILVIANLSANKILTASEKLNEIIEVTVSDATKTLTLDMDAGKKMVVKNNDAAHALVVENIAADTAITIPVSGVAIVISGTAKKGIFLMDTTA